MDHAVWKARWAATKTSTGLLCDMPFYDISRLWERGGLMHIA